MGGGSYDPESGDLYLTVQRADDGQGQYANPPVVLVYYTNLISAVDVFLGGNEISVYPNPTQNLFEIRGPISNFTIQILDSVGNLFEEINSPSNQLNIDVTDLPNGLYFVRIISNNNSKVFMKTIIKQ